MIWIWMVLTVVLQPGIQGDQRFILSRTKGTWQSAANSCRSARGSLAVLDSPAARRMFDRDINLVLGEKVWLGRIVGHTHIVTTEGCYSNQTLGYRRTSVLEDNYLVTCMARCPGVPYIGMQGTFCYCFDSLSPKANLLPGIHCNSRCPGEESRSPGTHVTQCGGQNARYNSVSVYRRVKPREIVLDVNFPNQGECITYNVRTGMWQPEDCIQTRRFTCDRKPCQFQQLCILESTTAATWFDGRTKCEGNGAYLATVNMTTNGYFNPNLNMESPIYWTGLHRKAIKMWTLGDIPSEIVPSDRCIALEKSQDGSLDWYTEWCSREYRYVCVKDYTTTTARPTQSVTSPWSTITSGTTLSSAKTRGDVMPTVNPFAEPVVVTSATPTLHHLHFLHLLTAGITWLMVLR